MSIYKLSLIPLCCCFALPVAAADWRECEQAKLRQLNLEHAAHTASVGGSKKHARSRTGTTKSREDANQLDEWLWKNCRNYANELRSLEQDRM